MRKAFTCTLLLLVLAVSGICLTARTVFAAHDQVAFDETIREGAPSAASGAVVNLDMQYHNQLFWNTTFYAGADRDPETDYACHLTPHYSQSVPRYNGVSLQNSYDDGISNFSPSGRVADHSPLVDAYNELYQETAPGEEGSMTINVRDYFEYYPINGEIDLPGCRLTLAKLAEVSDPGPGASYLSPAQWNDLQRFFRIPVLPDEQLELTLGRDSSGRVWHYGSGGGTSGDSFGMYTYSAITDDSCYFTFDCHTLNGKLVDTSLIPGGYGLYRLPYTTNADGTSTPQTDALEMVFPLDPESTLCGMRLDPTSTRLLLFTVKSDVFILTVVDLRSMQQLQQLPVCPVGERSVVANYDGGDFFTVLCSDNSFTLLQAETDGRYTPALTGRLPAEATANLYQGFDMAYDGTRLAVVSMLCDETHRYYIRGFSLCVCDADGLRFWGEYRSSLAAGFDPGSSYQYLCQLTDDDAFRVRWADAA